MDITATRDVLSAIEETALVQHEAIIARGLQTFYEVGSALVAIRDERLYRASHMKFEAYCQERWGMAASRARQFIAASEIVENIKSVTIVTLPATESQARPLARLTPEEQPVVWQRAVETAPNGRITAAHVERVAAELHPPVAPPTLRIADDLSFSDEPDEWDDEPLSPYEEQIAAQYTPPVVSVRDQQRQVLTSQESHEWYTPAWCIAAVRQVLDVIELDPASSVYANATVQAATIYTEVDNGLAHPWTAETLFLNPPYNGRASEWCRKALREYEDGNVHEGILLVFAKLGYAWFEELWNTYPTCFVRERIRFVSPPTTDAHEEAEEITPDGQAKHASAFVYFGPNRERFRDVFRQYGRVIFPEEAE